MRMTCCPPEMLRLLLLLFKISSRAGDGVDAEVDVAATAVMM